MMIISTVENGKEFLNKETTKNQFLVRTLNNAVRINSLDPAKDGPIYQVPLPSFSHFGPKDNFRGLYYVQQ